MQDTPLSNLPSCPQLPPPHTPHNHHTLAGEPLCKLCLLGSQVHSAATHMIQESPNVLELHVPVAPPCHNVMPAAGRWHQPTSFWPFGESEHKLWASFVRKSRAQPLKQFPVGADACCCHWSKHLSPLHLLQASAVCKGITTKHGNTAVARHSESQSWGCQVGSCPTAYIPCLLSTVGRCHSNLYQTPLSSRECLVLLQLLMHVSAWQHDMTSVFSNCMAAWLYVSYISADFVQ